MLKLLQQRLCAADGFARFSGVTTLRRLASSSVNSPALEKSNNTKSENEPDSPTAEDVSKPLPSSSEEENSQFENKQKRTPYRNEQEESLAHYRFIYPEFLPDPNIKWRNRVREKLERMDMLRRRSNIDIPEFYVGSILSVTVADKNAPGKSNSFVGICTERQANGLRSSFTLRNVVDGHGVEIAYDLYNPTITNITVLRLEKRLDDTLRYLRDAPLEYSTFPFDMVPEMRNPEDPVPVNTLKIKLTAKPWTFKWHLMDLKGVEGLYEELEPWQLKKFETWKYHTGYNTKQFDLMKTYRDTIPAEDQVEIYSEVHQQLAKLTASLKKQKRKRTFVKPQKTV